MAFTKPVAKNAPPNPKAKKVKPAKGQPKSDAQGIMSKMLGSDSNC